MANEDVPGVNECIVPAYVPLQVYQVLAILIGVVGNGFVIYASKQYSTFNLDSNTIFLVRHLGYVDIAILVLGFFPANFLFVRGLQPDEDPFKHLCTIQGICMNVFGLTALSITALISVHRLLRCTLPQVIARMRRNLMLGLVIVCYTGALSVAVLVMIISNDFEYRYDNGYYSCIGHFKSDKTPASKVKINEIARVVGMALSGLFFLIILLINVLLHHFSRKKLSNLSGNSVKKHKTSRYRTLTTHSISALLVVTWLPFAITFFITISMEYSSKRAPECSEIRHWATFAINFYLLNFVLNPLLYSVTNINFMKFVMKLIRKHCSNFLCVAQLCTRLNPDLDISTNVSTMDQVAGNSSNNCPVTPERVYSNMLTVPDQSSTKRKLSPAKSEPVKTRYLKRGGSKKRPVSAVITTNTNENKLVITVSDDIKGEIMAMSPAIKNDRKNKKKKGNVTKKTESKKVSV
ncbi:hypothetical protein ACHWQZ_G017651 [Mnemiopsis leidyi]